MRGRAGAPSVSLHTSSLHELNTFNLHGLIPASHPLRQIKKGPMPCWPARRAGCVPPTAR